jgi:hypothetical protein
MISKGFGFVAFFAGVKASSVCIRLSCLLCIQSVVHDVWSRLFCSHKGCSLPTPHVLYKNRQIKINETVILPVLLCWSIICRKELKMSEGEYLDLREVTGGW